RNAPLRSIWRRPRRPSSNNGNGMNSRNASDSRCYRAFRPGHFALIPRELRSSQHDNHLEQVETLMNQIADQKTARVVGAVLVLAGLYFTVSLFVPMRLV